MSTINQHVDGDGNAFSGSGDVQSNSLSTTGNQSPAIVAGGDVSISYNTSPEPAPPPVIPRQLPSPEPCFLHRDKELVWLNERLHPGKVAAVCGPGGMGKSALAAQAVSKLEPGRFPDGIIFHSFYHQPKVETALQAICQAFQVEAKTSLESTVRQVLSGRKALLILDGTEQADDLPALLRLRGLCGVLITSRKRTDALADRLDLKPLDEQPAAEVFRLYSGIAADDAGVAGICKLLGGWPMALRIAGRYISSTGESAADYLKWLEQEPFKELAGGQHQEENAALLLRRSVDAVSADARLALGVAGTLAFAPLAREPLAAMLEDDARRARAALNELVNYGLLERKTERWQISHALIHTYARKELALSKESLVRLAGYYIRFCYEQSQAGLEGYARLDAERAHCLRLMASCLNSKLLEEVKLLVRVIDIYLDRQGWWTEKLEAVGMRMDVAKQSGDRRDECVCLHNLGYIYWKRGENEKALAYYEQSLLTKCEIGNKQGVVSTLNGIGLIYQEQGEYERALEHYEQSLSIARETGDWKGEGMTLNNIGQLYDVQGDYEIALEHYEQSLSIRHEFDDKIGEGIVLDNIAAIYRVKGNPANALEYCKQSLAIFHKIGDRGGEALSRWNIARTYEDLGDLTKAEEHISLAVQLAEQISHPRLEQFRERLAQVRAARRG